MVDSTTPTLDTEPASRERLAWAIMLLAFTGCLLVSLLTPLGGRWYFQNATRSQLASLQGTSGVTRLEEQAGREPVAIEAGRSKDDVVEGTTIRTDGSSQALLLFFDRTSLTLFPNSELEIVQMRRPRFIYGTQPPRIVVKLKSGRTRVQVAPATESNLHLEVQTPQALAPRGGIVLAVDSYASYAIEVTNEVSHVSVRTGHATVTGQTGQSVALAEGERAEIPLGTAALGPFAAKRNLLVNSEMLNPEAAVPISNGPLVPGWIAQSDQGGDGGGVDGTVDVVTLGASRALHFARSGSASNHGETGVVQPVNKLVGDYSSLSLHLDVLIVSQSLSGGGEQSSEFPLIVRVDYMDGGGSPQHWTHGFYCQNPVGFYVSRASELPCNTRRSFEIDLKSALDRPQQLISVTLYASGWDWDVYASDVALIAE